MLTVTVEAVKRKACFLGDDLDEQIDALIEEYLPVIEYALAPEHLDNPTQGLLDTLNLGALEIIAGEWLACLLREEGALDSVRAGALETKPPSRPPNPADPSGLMAQGWARLEPCLRNCSAIHWTTATEEE
ncbi:MAG: hypothetical protein KIT45_09440 [Fimbriimonadia bacterium]|nr:hypothetical protein [Fimbriimonadia bacterium]